MKRVPRVCRSRPGSRSGTIKRFCGACEKETRFKRRVRPSGHLQHDCLPCQARRAKKRNTLTKNSWRAMHDRCSNPNVRNYRYYGGRGITICERWESFDAFVEDMGERPDRDLTLDRIDVDRGYEPENCRWVTWDVQIANRRKSGVHPNEIAMQLDYNDRRRAVRDGKRARVGTV